MEWKHIGGKYLILNGIGTVSWYWTDDEGKMHTSKYNTIIYFTASPVNILSTTVLAESIKDYEGTWVLTKRKYHIFTWDFGK